MTKTTYTATASDGSVFTRKTDRTYTHVVVSTDSYAIAKENAESRGARKTDISNFNFYVELVAKWDSGLEPRSWDNPGRVRETVAKHGTADAYADAMLEARRAKLAARLANGEFEDLRLVGFCGRRDLAEKLAAKQRCGDNRVEILEAIAK